MIDKEIKQHWTDSYQDVFTFKEKPVSEIYLMKLAHEMVKWARENEDALVLADFFNNKGIHRSDIQRWVGKHLFFKNAYEMTKSIIGSRREKGALLRKYDSTIVMRTMSIYDPEWKELELWRAKLKEDQINNEPKVIVIKEFSDGKREQISPEKEISNHNTDTLNRTNNATRVYEG